MLAKISLWKNVSRKRKNHQIQCFFEVAVMRGKQFSKFSNKWTFLLWLEFFHNSIFVNNNNLFVSLENQKILLFKGAYSASDMVWQDRCSAVQAQKAIYSHVLSASIYQNCEIGIKLVSRVQIPIEASLEKLFTPKIKICPQQTAFKSDMEIFPAKLTVEQHNLTISPALRCTGNLQDQSYR